MFVTLDTSHFSSGWLKLEASANIPSMFVTRYTSHSSRGWLKQANGFGSQASYASFANKKLMSVTLDTSQCEMCP